MLILTRRPGDAILLDGGIRIVVLANDHSGVRIGIEAPPSVGIVREEIVDRIVDENRRAGATIEARKWLERLQSGDTAPDVDSGEGGDTLKPKATPSSDPGKEPRALS